MSRVLMEGALGLNKRKGVEPRHFVLREDRLEYHKTQDDALNGMDPRGQLKLSDVQQMQVSETSLVIRLADQNLKLCSVAGHAPLKEWADAFESAGVKSVSPGASEESLPLFRGAKSMAEDELKAASEALIAQEAAKEAANANASAEAAPRRSSVPKIENFPGEKAEDKDKDKEKEKAAAAEQPAHRSSLAVAGLNKGRRNSNPETGLKDDNSTDAAAAPAPRRRSSLDSSGSKRSSLAKAAAKAEAEAEQAAKEKAAKERAEGAEDGEEFGARRSTLTVASGLSGKEAEAAAKAAGTVEEDEEADPAAEGSPASVSVATPPVSDNAVGKRFSQVFISEGVLPEGVRTAVILKGMLEIVKKHTNSRFFVLFPKHLEYFNSEEEFESPEGVPRGKILLSDIMKVELQPDCMLGLTVRERYVQLKAPSEEEQKRWAEAWGEAIAADGRPDFEIAVGDGTAADPEEDTVAPAAPEQKGDDEAEEGEDPTLELASPEADMMDRRSSLTSPTKSVLSPSPDTVEGQQRRSMRRGRSSVTFSQVETVEVEAITNLDSHEEPSEEKRKKPLVSQEERDKVAKLQTWVSREKPPVKRGTFQMSGSKGDYGRRKYIEFYDDDDPEKAGLLVYDAPEDSAGGSPFGAEGKIYLVDVKDLEPLDGRGFEITLKNEQTIVLEGPHNSDDDWFEAVSDRLERMNEKKDDEEDQSWRQKRTKTLKRGGVNRLARRNSAPIASTAILTDTHLDLSSADELAKVRIDLNDIQALRMNSQGFEVVMADGTSHFVQVAEGEREEWLAAWATALAEGFEQTSEGQWKKHKVLVLHKGEIDVAKASEETQKRYCVVFTDRLAVFDNIKSAKTKQPPLYEVLPRDVRMVRVHDDGIEIGLEKDELGLHSNTKENLDTWFEAIKTCFSRQPADEQDVPLSERFPDLPASADPRALAMTCRDKVDPTGKPTCQGVLGFYDNGHLSMRYAVLYPARLDAWDSVEDMLHLAPAKVSVKLQDVGSIETLQSGFILDILRPLRRKRGIHVGHPQELAAWYNKIWEAIEKLKASKEIPESKGAKSRNWMLNTRQQPLVSSGSLERAPGAGVKMAPRPKKVDLVPRCARVLQKERPAPEPNTGSALCLGGGRRTSMRMSAHRPPESHIPLSGKDQKGVVVNTHVTGYQAHKPIQRAPVPDPKEHRRPASVDRIANYQSGGDKTSPILKPRHSNVNIIATSPIGQRTVRRPSAPGNMQWQKITDFERARSTSPQARYGYGLMN